MNTTRNQAEANVRRTVLFVCAHNAGRSQLAAGLAAARAGDTVRVLSAGTNPGERVDATVLASLAELGIDRSDQVPQPVTPELIAQADVVIALKPNLALPAHPHVETWPLPDPEGWDLEGIRSLRNHLDHRIEDLLTEIVP